MAIATKNRRGCCMCPVVALLLVVLYLTSADDAVVDLDARFPSSIAPSPQMDTRRHSVGTLTPARSTICRPSNRFTEEVDDRNPSPGATFDPPVGSMKPTTTEPPEQHRYLSQLLLQRLRNGTYNESLHEDDIFPTGWRVFPVRTALGPPRRCWRFTEASGGASDARGPRSRRPRQRRSQDPSLETS